MNNPLTDDIPKYWDESCNYIAWQKEQGENGTPHLQGCLNLKQAKGLPGMKKLSKHAHWEPMHGTIEQASHYARKPHENCECEHCVKARALPNGGRLAGPWEIGDLPQPGKRNDLIALKRAIEEGKSELEIAQSEDTFCVWARHFKALERYKRLRTVDQRTWPTKTLVFWGPPGLGKTRQVRVYKWKWWTTPY